MAIEENMLKVILKARYSEFSLNPSRNTLFRMFCSKVLCIRAVLLTYWLRAAVLYLAVSFGWVHRCAMTRCDRVCVYGSIIGIAHIMVWMIFVCVYVSHLKSKYRRMLEQATAAPIAMYYMLICLSRKWFLLARAEYTRVRAAGSMGKWGLCKACWWAAESGRSGLV